MSRLRSIDAAGGALLVGAALVALAWANAPWPGGYERWWTTQVTIDLGVHQVAQDLRHWINDGLMTLFFFVIGLEIKHELAHGRLNTFRTAAIPVAGAIGGMAVPALVYLGLNRGGGGADGWGIPMATDVAFAVGVLSLLGERVPGGIKAVLLGLAVVDDLGAIVVIAAFYANGVEGRWLVVAAAGLGLVALLSRVGLRSRIVFVVLGIVVWWATFESGVHATISGVALGLVVPMARPPTRAGEVRSDGRSPVAASAVHGHADSPAHVALPAPLHPPITAHGSPAMRIQRALHPWTSLVVVPLFALANAGITLSAETLRSAVASPVTAGVVLGLVVGKLVGVSTAIAVAVRLRIGELPQGVTLRHVVGMGGLAGIGFTVSIFVAGLAFDDPARAEQATIGVLVASVLASALGSVILLRLSRARP